MTATKKRGDRLTSKQRDVMNRIRHAAARAAAVHNQPPIDPDVLDADRRTEHMNRHAGLD